MGDGRRGTGITAMMAGTREKLLTLCIVYDRDSGRVLLGLKKRGFGEGRWNGFGGKVQEGETIEEAARRELTEEAGIVAPSCEQRGVLRFVFDNDPVVHEVYVFVVSLWHGEPRETDEMRPRWFSLDAIPYDTMWPDDRHWLPLLLAGKHFRGAFRFIDDELRAYEVGERISSTVV